jgi:hypothetical protein
MRPVRDYPAYLLEIAFKEDATLYELLAIALAFAVFWGLFFEAGKVLLRRLTHDRPWLRLACEREYERSAKKMFEDIGLTLTKEEAVEHMMRDQWPDCIVIISQHAAGSILCIPSLLGMGDASWASSLACLGCLSEIGWEFENTAEIVYKRFFTVHGEKKMPNLIVFLLLLHHSLASSLGLPMVIHYRNLWVFHQVVFDLQLASVTLILTEYSKLLDIAKANDLWKFKVCNFLMLALYVWTRLIHWIYLSAHMTLTWYHDKAWTFMAVGAVMILLFSFFNAVFIVIPTYQRYMKFLRVSAEHDSLPLDASEKQRRQSIIQLEAAREVLVEYDLEDRILSFLDSLNDKKKVERRMTLPPRSMKTWRSTRMMRSVPAHGWKKD